MIDGLADKIGRSRNWASSQTLLPVKGTGFIGSIGFYGDRRDDDL